MLNLSFGQASGVHLFRNIDVRVRRGGTFKDLKSFRFILLSCSVFNSLFILCFAEKVPFGHIDGVKFYLSTKSAEHVEANVAGTTLFGDKFDPKRNTKILIHGFLNNYKHGEFIPNLKSAYLNVQDVNVIGVDWSWWTSQSYVRIAELFLRVVAKRIASFIKMLVQQYKTDLSAIHLIGHSLGAHTSGMVGLLIQKYMDGEKLGRITGLDPAAQGFLGKDLKLTKDCAKFVDVLHADDYGFGLTEANAHVDFYINGGNSQPTCGTKPGVCSHSMAHHYWEQATLNSTAFLAVKCDSWISFSLDFCCNKEKTHLGEDTSNKARGYFYLVTSNEPPYGLGKAGVRVPYNHSLLHYIYSPDPTKECTESSR